jgi:peptide deformylase
VQHEIDHLDGVLFLDRLVSRRNDLFRRKNYQTPGKQGGANSK